MTRSTGKKVLGHVGVVMFTFATMLTVVAGHVADPARQVMNEVREVSKAFIKPRGEDRPWVLELCAGHGEVTQEFERQGYPTMTPVDIERGDDLKDIRTRKVVIQSIKKNRPRLVVMGWPCRLWGSLTNLNCVGPEGQQELRRLRKKEMPLLEFFAEVTALQLARGDHALGENPLYAKSFDTKAILGVLDK